MTEEPIADVVERLTKERSRFIHNMQLFQPEGSPPQGSIETHLRWVLNSLVTERDEARAEVERLNALIVAPEETGSVLRKHTRSLAREAEVARAGEALMRSQWQARTRERDEARADLKIAYRENEALEAMRERLIAENAALRGQLLLHGHAVEIGDDSLGVEWLAREKRLRAVAREAYAHAGYEHERKCGCAVCQSLDALQPGDLGEPFADVLEVTQ